MEYLCTTCPRIDDKLSNRIILTEIKALHKIVIDNRAIHHVIIRKDFIDKYFPYDSISEYINNVKRINPNIRMSTDGYVVQDEVDKEFLSIINDNLNKDDLTTLLQFKEHDFLEMLVKLIKTYSSNKKFELEGASIISNLREHIDSLDNEIDSLKDSLKKELINKSDLQSKLSVLINRINYTHNVGVDENMLFRTKINSYDKVIYFKELTRVQFTDTLIIMLKEILEILYNMPTRILVIEGYYANGKLKQYPTLVPHFRLTERDVVSSDILMLGYQPKLFRDIMRNPSNISFMLILDRSGYASPHLFGDNIEYFFTASDLKDVDDSIPLSRVISYTKESLYIPLIKGFKDFNASEKLKAYSSIKLVKQIISLL